MINITNIDIPSQIESVVIEISEHIATNNKELFDECLINLNKAFKDLYDADLAIDICNALAKSLNENMEPRHKRIALLKEFIEYLETYSRVNLTLH